MFRRFGQTILMLGAIALLLGGCGNNQQKNQASSGKLKLQQIDFDLATVGQAPPGFSTAVTDGGAPGTWVVLEDATSRYGKNVLAQTSTDPTNARYPLCIFDEVSAKDVAVSVAYKPVSGKVDQAAGIAIRLKDKDNYYLLRANALENNVRFYKVVGGKRTQLATAGAPVASGQWHSLAIRSSGKGFEASMDGKLVLSAEDDTFKDAGKIALWTKADSVTYFDRLSIVTEPGQ